MFIQVVAPIVNLLNSLLTPLLMIVVAVGGLYCILLGTKYAKAEEPQEREKAKGALVNAVVGFALIFILVLAMNLTLPIMRNWVNNSYNQAGYSGTLIGSEVAPSSISSSSAKN